MSTGEKVGSDEPDLRVYLAVERTLLAWIRTGLALMGFGFVVARFGLFLRALAGDRGAGTTEQGGISLWFGTALIFVGVAVHLLAAWQHVSTVQRLRKGEMLHPMRVSTGVVLSYLLSALGLAMATYLLIL